LTAGRPRGILAVLLLTIALGACTPASPDASASGSTPPGEAASCSPLDLNGPSGTHFLLTGVWRANSGGRYYLHQQGSCLYWFGSSQDLSREQGSNWANIFFGHIGSDFSIVGDWGDVPYTSGASMNSGTLSLVIDFDESGPIDYPILHQTGSTGGFGDGAWQLEDTLPAATELVGTVGYNQGSDQEVSCIWMDSGGSRYELLVGFPPDHPPPADGTSVRVVGRLAPVLGGPCAPQTILVDTFEALP